MPALWMATSEPEPMAMPTSAWARAGASLTPSPAMATRWPAFCREKMAAALSWGFSSAWTLVDAADGLGHRLGGHGVVARQHDDAQPFASQRLDGRAGVGLDWIGYGQQPGQSAVHRHVHDPSARQPVGVGLGVEGRRIDIEPAHLTGVPNGHGRAIHPSRSRPAPAETQNPRPWAAGRWRRRRRRSPGPGDVRSRPHGGRGLGQPRFDPVAQGVDGDEPGLALGQGARLVDDQGVDPRPAPATPPRS